MEGFALAVMLPPRSYKSELLTPKPEAYHHLPSEGHHPPQGDKQKKTFPSSGVLPSRQRLRGVLSIPRALPPVTHSSALQAPERMRGSGDMDDSPHRTYASHSALLPGRQYIE